MLGARLTAATTGIMLVTVGAEYLGPEQLVRRPLLPGQVSAVVYIEHYFTFAWPLLFIGSGLALLLAATRKQGFVTAHIAAAGILALYGAAILYSALLTEPPIPVVQGTFASFTALINLAVARGCAERGLR